MGGCDIPRKTDIQVKEARRPRKARLQVHRRKEAEKRSEHATVTEICNRTSSNVDDSDGECSVEARDDQVSHVKKEHDDENKQNISSVCNTDDKRPIEKKKKKKETSPMKLHKIQKEEGNQNSLNALPEKVDEYQYDSSDEEDIRNTVGNIPMNWYDEYPHIGYDLTGEKIMKPVGDDEIDDFLKKIDDPNYWRTVKDKLTGQKVVLNDEDVDFIQRVQGGRYPTDANMYQPFEDFFTYETMKHPLSNRPEHKRSFIPSRIEREKVGKLVHAIKMGWIKPRVPKEEEKPQFYMLWDKDTGQVSKRMQHYIPAPKMKLPGHEESYNPPPEYLFTKEEEEKWKDQEPEERKINFIPQKHSCLRLVPSYPEFIKERFERCLDLYLCPRQRKMRVNVNPDDLIPKLPKPRDLQPFPTVLSMVYTGHTAKVSSISVEPLGQFLASGSADKTVKIWEVLTGRCLRTFHLENIVNSVAWCPNESICLILVAAGDMLFVINPAVGDKVVISNTDVVMKTLKGAPDQKVVQWCEADENQLSQGIRMVIKHQKEISQVTWHGKGDYFASLMPNGLSKSVVIHKLSQAQSQLPFQRLKGLVQRIQFHPLKPYFFIATQRYVRMYNLLKHELSKKLMANCKWISSMAVHPQGDNVIIGSYDCRLSWFDLELSTKPYKTLRHHKKSLRQVAFHRRYPLFASASNDGTLIVCHGMVYSDLLQSATIVPLKILKGNEGKNPPLSDCIFHPTLPWVFSACDDGTVKLYS